MKKLMLIISTEILVCCNTAQVQNKSQNILESKNISEIEEFLKTAHPDDPKRSVLKSKVIALKNSEWTKGKKDAKPMEARPVISEISSNLMKNSNASETEEFKRLIASTPAEHKDKTVKLLNAMFNEDISSKEVILLFKNNSDCNIVLRIQGKDFYNLAVPAKGENSIVINKGSYTLTSHVCDVLYSSQKEIKKSIFLTINNPVQTGK
ncbi:DUF6759 domain-containing protein [Chryseobacterium gambrini]|uniref:DUF6759 domain-containing protein n=1 Tax=Chryseobacterium gambrini TaxID=373672 RepID=UPI0022F1AB2A|nr:DUF6759 domain-containing protein [Chryseobacterium gambrini]WBV50820.1 hypothetical protein PFY09_10750 [Chryseobacterium gambrini]WBX99196.1 hypothetical protein PE065_08045 [Chryseobacterium gambrini]